MYLIINYINSLDIFISNEQSSNHTKDSRYRE